MLVHLNSEAFKRTVQHEAQRLYKSRFVTKFSKARQSVSNDVADFTRRTEDI